MGFDHRHLPFRWQNRMLLAASCLFYGAWDWRFLVLLVISTSIDYVVARRIEASRSESIRRRLLFVSCAANLGILGFSNTSEPKTGQNYLTNRLHCLFPDALHRRLDGAAKRARSKFKIRCRSADVKRAEMSCLGAIHR
jgi:hypothetical protein